MKVKELIELLQQQDKEKEVMIQQGEVFDYMTIHWVRIVEISMMNDDLIEAVCIEY